MKTYRVKYEGIGYEKNVKAVERAILMLPISDMTRRVLAETLWHISAPGDGCDFITFTDKDIAYAKNLIMKDLQNI
jgi:hypothetical protein